jgi:hypothetical protein
MPDLLPGNVKTYLNKNGLEQKKVVGRTSGINCCICVPSLNEFENLKALLDSLAANDSEYFSDSLILIIVNNTENAGDAVKQNNLLTINYLHDIVTGNSTPETSEIVKSGLRIAYIDTSTNGNGLDNGEGGVGLARKIAMDESLRIFDYASPERKIIVCLDADCTVDKNYLTEIRRHFSSSSSNAAVVNYHHISKGSSITDYAIVCYEIYLRYYELALRYAKSPYAFHTIGSTIICDVPSYIKAEGMNKRKAAEDFYFLNKLSKFCKVEKINSTCVYPSSRVSYRVPFGTGQRVARYLEHVKNEYELYNPVIFRELKLWNEYYLSDSFNAEDSTYIPGSIKNYLEENNFYNSYIKIKDNSKTGQQLLKQKIRWFDAFRTLKYVHFAKDFHFSNVNMFKAVEWLLGEYGYPLKTDCSPSIEEQREILNILQNL